MIAQETIGSVDPADWLTIWQSELAALAVDPECAENLLAWGQAWITATADPARRAAADDPARRASTDAPEGPAPTGLAPDVERELARLRQRIAELGRGG